MVHEVYGEAQPRLCTGGLLRFVKADVDSLTVLLCARRNVPGVSLYFLTLSKFRSFVGQFPQMRAGGAALPTNGGKVKLTTAGDLLVGSTARTGVGFLLMPFTLLKTLSEVSRLGLAFAEPR